MVGDSDFISLGKNYFNEVIMDVLICLLELGGSGFDIFDVKGLFIEVEKLVKEYDIFELFFLSLCERIINFSEECKFDNEIKNNMDYIDNLGYVIEDDCCLI